MKRTFVINNQKYAIVPCTVIPQGGDETYRQDALYIVSLPVTEEKDATGEYCITGVDYSAEMTESVVFGWSMPKNVEDFVGMLDDFMAWEPFIETVDTVKIDGTELSELREQLGSTLGLL